MEKRFICDLPWNHISVHPHSMTSICCAAKHSNGVSNAKEENGDIITINDGIEETINSFSYKQIRKTMLEGGVPEACEGCHKVEQVGGFSKRLKDSNFILDYDNLTSPDGSIKVNLTNVELRLGNFCNLKCRSCNAESSTSWITDFNKLKDSVPLPSSYDILKNSKHTDYSWVENETFYDDLIANAPNLQVIHISGGEPFLAPKHFYLLEKLLHLGKTDVRINYITNANWDYKKVKKALDLLNNFRYVYISFSLDDVGARNTYIRSLSNWDLTIKNIKTLIDNYPKFWYNITQTINAYNFLYVEELSQFLLNEGIYSYDKRNRIKTLELNHVHSPEYQNANVLPKEVRQKKIDSIRGLLSESNWQELYGRYYNGDENNQMDVFKKVTTAVDAVRNETFGLIFPELDKIINQIPKKLI
jgi:MoaA/NifB/PqqE/SkfB family radical SAM enzyme